MLTFLLLSVAVAAPQPAHDSGPEARAAAELLAGISQKARGENPPLLLTPLGGPAAEAAAFGQRLERALRAAGARLIDRQALTAASKEAALTARAEPGILQELAGSLGARVVVSGSVLLASGEARAELRAVEVETGRVVATSSVPLGAGSGAPAGAGGLREATVEGQLRRLSDAIAAGVAKLPGEARYERFAVLPFEETGPSAKDKQLGTVVSAELTTLLHRDHGLMLVERSQLARVIDELSLGQTGLTDPARSAEVGKLAGAEGLILGTVSELGDRYGVVARVVGAREAQVVHTAEVSLPAADLVALSADAVVLRSRSGAIYRSLLLPGWGQAYNRQPVKSAVFAALEVVGLGLAVGYHVYGNRLYDRYLGLDPSAPAADFAARRADARGAYERRNLFLWCTLAVHLAGVADAALSGRSYGSSSFGGD